MQRQIFGLVALTFLAACPEPEVRTIDLNNTGAGEAVGVLLDSDGEPILGPDNQPIPVDANGIPLIAAPQKTGAIEDDPNRIVLSDYTQEQQKRDREAYAAQQAAIAAQRDEVGEVAVPDSPVISVTAYARTTPNHLGVKNYNRSGRSGGCGYGSAVDAQRKFLESGGPEQDPRGMDPDGDGFACNFDPAPYRNLY